MEYYKNLDLQDIVYFCEVDLIEKTEQWKDIPKYKNHYQVSDLGRVKSLKITRKYSEKIIKPSFQNMGYLSVSLNINKN